MFFGTDFSSSNFYEVLSSSEFISSRSIKNPSDEHGSNIREKTLVTFSKPESPFDGVGYEVADSSSNNSGYPSVGSCGNMLPSSFQYCGGLQKSLGNDPYSDRSNVFVNHSNAALALKEDVYVYAESARMSLPFSPSSNYKQFADFQSLSYDCVFTELDAFAYQIEDPNSPHIFPVITDTKHSPPAINHDSSSSCGKRSVKSSGSDSKLNSCHSQRRSSQISHGSSRDVQKRQSHNNMEKMRRRVVAHAFDMVVKSIGHESTRKPSKVTILSLAYEFCKKYYSNRESTIKMISSLASARLELKNKIMPYLSK